MSSSHAHSAIGARHGGHKPLVARSPSLMGKAQHNQSRLFAMSIVHHGGYYRAEISERRSDQ